MPWQPGESGNPKGRKVEKIISDQVRLVLNEEGDKDGKKVKKLRLLAQALVEKAIDGSPQHMAFILDRMEGKVAQPISGDDDSPLKLTIELQDATRREDPAPE